MQSNRKLPQAPCRDSPQGEPMQLRAVRSGAAGVAWATPLLKVREESTGMLSGGCCRSFHFSTKFVAIIRTFHKSSIAAVYTYSKTSH